MNNDFLMTYRYEDFEGYYGTDYNWYSSRDEMNCHLEIIKDTFKEVEILECHEIYSSNDITSEYK